MKISEAKQLIQAVLSHNIDMFTKGKQHQEYVVPLLTGDPGLGKTSINKQVAEEFEIPFDSTIVAQYDAGELAGFPMPDQQRQKMIRYRPDFLPDGDPIIEKGKVSYQAPVSIWLLDEIGQAPVAVQNLVAQIVNEWRIGEHRVHPGTTIVAATNKASNRAGTNTMPTHLRDRFMHIDIEVDHQDFLNWGNANGLHPSIIAYIRKNPASLAMFDATARSCPSPRSWAKVSVVLYMELSKTLRHPAIAGYVGVPEAVKFETFLRIADRMPDPTEVIRNPDKAPVFGAKDSDVLLLLLANIASLCDKANIGNIVKYLNRLPNAEYAVYCMNDCKKRCPEISQSKAFSDWCVQTGGSLYD